MEDSRIQTFVPVQEIFIPNIMVLGAGGAGGNVVTRMVSEGVQNVRMVVCNTDQKALQRNKADVKIDLGRQLTRGMGAGARPEIGAGAAEDSIRDIENVIKSGGLAKQKAPRIKRVLNEVKQEVGSFDLSFLMEMPLDSAKEWLTKFNGVGPKTAAIILCFSFGLPAMPVDTHIFRVARRLRLIGPKINAEKAHERLEPIVPPEEVFQFHMYLITVSYTHLTLPTILLV